MSIATTAKQEQHSAPGTATRDAGMVKWAQPGAKAAAMQRRPALCQPFDGIVHLDKELDRPSGKLGQNAQEAS
jgi:hypothetical protein